MPLKIVVHSQDIDFCEPRGKRDPTAPAPCARPVVVVTTHGPSNITQPKVLEKIEDYEQSNKKKNGAERAEQAKRVKVPAVVVSKSRTRTRATVHQANSSFPTRSLHWASRRAPESSTPSGEGTEKSAVRVSLPNVNVLKIDTLSQPASRAVSEAAIQSYIGSIDEIVDLMILTLNLKSSLD